MKRIIDFMAALTGLIIFFPILVPVLFIVWIQDWHSPFYIANRVGRNETNFKMIKLRSMVINAEKSGVDSTSANDKRITPIGKFIRNYKLDEITQLWNVLIGDMSLVGPRPNVKRETDLYTNEEKKLLSVKPGITDFSSIVFADEGDILKESNDPDITYNQVIRPYKSRLGIFYIEKMNWILDINLIFLTAFAIVSRGKALIALTNLMKRLRADKDLILVASRSLDLVPAPPPGASKIVTNREGRIED